MSEHFPAGRDAPEGRHPRCHDSCQVAQSDAQLAKVARGRRRLPSADVDVAVAELMGEVHTALGSGASKARLPPLCGKGSIQQRFHAGKPKAELIHRRARARLSLAGLWARRGIGNCVEYHNSPPAPSAAAHPARLQCRPIAAASRATCACGAKVTSARLRLDDGSEVPVGFTCYLCLRSVIAALAQKKMPKLRAQLPPQPQAPPAKRRRWKSSPAAFACPPAPSAAASDAAEAAETAAIVPLLWRLKRSLAGFSRAPDLRAKQEGFGGSHVKQELSVSTFSMQNHRLAEKVAVAVVCAGSRHSAVRPAAKREAPEGGSSRMQHPPLYAIKGEAQEATRSEAKMRPMPKRWKREALQNSTVAPCLGQFGRTSRSPGASGLLGDESLPGWSARLVDFLGEDAAAAKALACASQRALKLLVADATQLAAELRPALRSLADAVAWGSAEEQTYARALGPAQVLSVLSPLRQGRASMALSSSPAPAELVAELEGLRVRRVDGLLAALASRACGVARALDPRPHMRRAGF